MPTQDDDVGILAYLQATNAVGDSNDLGRIDGDGLQSLVFGHALAHCQRGIDRQVLDGRALVGLYRHFNARPGHQARISGC